jgi:hypothetical protein
MLMEPDAHLPCDCGRNTILELAAPRTCKSGLLKVTKNASGMSSSQRDTPHGTERGAVQVSVASVRA